MAKRETSQTARGRVGALVERDFELAQLTELVDGLVAGHGRVAVIEGGDGLGKSSLLKVAIELARAKGVTVLSALGTAVADDLPWLCARELFEPCLRDDPDAELLLSGAASLTAAALGRDAEPQTATGGSAAAMHGLYWLVANLAERGSLMITVDDVQLIDAQSLRWLVYLARRLNDLPVLVLATTAPLSDTAGPELCALLDGAAEVISLGELSDEGAAAIVRARLGDDADPEFTDACLEAAGRNPFLLGELLSEIERNSIPPIAANAERVASALSPNVNRMVQLKLARSGEHAVPVARAVAVLGAEASLRNVADLAEVDQDTAAATAGVLDAEELLDRSLPLRFAHPLVRSVVYEGIAPVDRTRWHRRAATMLSRRGAAPEAVAAQLIACEPAGDPISVRMLRDAAGHALRTGAPETAVRFLARARDEVAVNGEDAGLLRELGTAEASAGSPDAAEHLRRAHELETAPGPRANAAQMLGSVLTRSGRSPEAVKLLDQALAELDHGPVDNDARLRLEAEAIASAREDFSTRRLIHERIERLAGLEGATVAELVLLANMAMESASTGLPAASETIELAQRALGGGRLVNEETADSPSCYLAIHSLVAADRADLAVRHLEQAFANARERGSVFGLGVASICSAHANNTLGDVSIGDSHARTALRIASAAGWAGMAPWAVAFLVDALVERGELDEAESQIERAGLAGPLPEAPFFEPLATARARLALARHDYEAALVLTHLGELLAECGSVNPAMSSWRTERAGALAGLGREDEARALAEEELALARAYGAARPIGAALRSLARHVSDAERVELLREATQVLEHSPARLERAHALVDLGTALRVAGDKRESREPIRRGLDLATECSAHALVGRAREELLASGARPRREAVTGPAALTPAELRVARMAVDGPTNREIAENLFVTLRTVELHLTHVYRKLGISSRAELAKALEPTGEDT